VFCLKPWGGYARCVNSIFLVVVPKELRVNKLLQHYHLKVVSLSSKNDAYHGTENVVEGGMLVNG
jgi:hypothetical protein